MRKNLRVLFVILILITLFEGNLYGEDKSSNETRDNLNALIRTALGVTDNYLWRGVLLINGPVLNINHSINPVEGLVFDLSHNFDLTSLDTKLHRYNLYYYLAINKTLSIQGGFTLYDITSSVMSYPDTLEGYLKLEHFGTIYYSGALYYDFYKGSGAFVELSSKYSLYMIDNISIGPGANLYINLSDKLFDSYNGSFNTQAFQAFGFSKMTLSKKIFLDILGGISLPLYSSSSNTAIYTTKYSPFASMAFSFLIK